MVTSHYLKRASHVRYGIVLYLWCNVKKWQMLEDVRRVSIKIWNKYKGFILIKTYTNLQFVTIKILETEFHIFLKLMQMRVFSRRKLFFLKNSWGMTTLYGSIGLQLQTSKGLVNMWYIKVTFWKRLYLDS